MGSRGGLDRRDGIVALAFAVAFAIFIALSWQKWPLVTADSARELYVPFQMLHGQRLYEDFYYLYGPVAPVLNSTLLAAVRELWECARAVPVVPEA
jgi:hypothetical protein